MITIKLPKSPRTAPRRKIQEIGEKYDYSEDSYFSIIKIPEINDDLNKILNIMTYWKNSSCNIDEEEIETRDLKMILECIREKVPQTNLRWYNLGMYSLRNVDINYVKSDIERINKRGDESEFGFGGDYIIDKLQEISLVKPLISGGGYEVEKERFKEEIIGRIKLIKKIYPEFNGGEILKVIDSFPEKIVVKDKREETEEREKKMEEVEKMEPKEIAKMIIGFAKKEFPDELEWIGGRTSIFKYDIIPLFLKKKGLIRVPEEIKFKIKKAEILSEKLMEEEMSKKFEKEEEGKDYITNFKFMKDVLNLLKKIEENTKR